MKLGPYGITSDVFNSKYPVALQNKYHTIAHHLKLGNKEEAKVLAEQLTYDEKQLYSVFMQDLKEHEKTLDREIADIEARKNALLNSSAAAITTQYSSYNTKPKSSKDENKSVSKKSKSGCSIC